MPKSKKFDCVKMKWMIQQRILTDFAGVPPNEALQIQKKQIEQDPILGPFLKRVIKINGKPAAAFWKEVDAKKP